MPEGATSDEAVALLLGWMRDIANLTETIDLGWPHDLLDHLVRANLLEEPPLDLVGEIGTRPRPFRWA